MLPELVVFSNQYGFLKVAGNFSQRHPLVAHLPVGPSGTLPGFLAVLHEGGPFWIEAFKGRNIRKNEVAENVENKDKNDKGSTISDELHWRIGFLRYIFFWSPLQLLPYRGQEKKCMTKITKTEEPSAMKHLHMFVIAGVLALPVLQNAEAASTEGSAVFTRNCSVCHTFNPPPKTAPRLGR